MYRTEFLEVIRTQLEGQMQEGKIAAHLRYYEDYIQSKVRMGEAEETVLAQLGDPRLIAKSLLDADPGADSMEDPSDHYHGYDSEEEEIREMEGTSSHDFLSVIRRIAYFAAAVFVIYILFRMAVRAVPFFLLLILVLFIVTRLVHRDR